MEAIRYDKIKTYLKKAYEDDEFQYAQKQYLEIQTKFKLNKYKEFCEEIGFTPGTEKFGECVLQAMKVE